LSPQGRGVRRVRRAVLAFAAVVAFSAPVARADTAPDDAAVLKAFAAIAFGEEGVADPDPRLKKWQRALRVSIDAEIALEPGERAVLDAHLTRLGALTGLRIVEMQSAALANYTIRFTRQADFRARIEAQLDPQRRFLLEKLAAAGCVGLFRSLTETHEIVEAVVIVPLDAVRARGRFAACLREETTQVLGLANDSSAVGRTLFDDNGTEEDLTPLDVLLLRLLYHPALTPGMDRAAALAAAQRALPEIRAAP
jgi:hypothetical protein